MIALSIIYVVYYYGSEFDSFADYFQSVTMIGCWITLSLGNVSTLLKVLSRKNQIYDITKLINRKNLATTLFFAATVGKSVAKQWAMYGMHMVKSVSKQSSKFVSVAGKRGKKKNDKKKDKEKEKSNDKDAVTTKKQS